MRNAAVRWHWAMDLRGHARYLHLSRVFLLEQPLRTWSVHR